MGLIKVKCSLCGKSLLINQDRFDKSDNIYCSRVKCKKNRNWVSHDGTQGVKKW